MTKEEIQKLKVLAEAASPGPWEDRLELNDSGIEDEDGACICHIQDHGSINTMARTGEHFSHADARYIAAAHPQAILALIAELDEWKSMISTNRMHVELTQYRGALEECEMQLRDALKK